MKDDILETLETIKYLNKINSRLSLCRDQLHLVHRKVLILMKLDSNIGRSGVSGHCSSVKTGLDTLSTVLELMEKQLNEIIEL